MVGACLRAATASIIDAHGAAARARYHRRPVARVTRSRATRHDQEEGDPRHGVGSAIVGRGTGHVTGPTTMEGMDAAAETSQKTLGSS